MSRLDTNGYYALGIPAYLALMWLEARYLRRRGRGGYPLARTLGNLSTSLGEVVIGLFLGPLLIALYDFGYQSIALIHWSEGSWVPWLLGIVASDFCYYWHHRAGHRLGALWAIHQVHHQCDRFDLSIALRHPWLSDVYAAPFYALMPLLGVPALPFFVGISIVSFYALSIHSPMFDRPSLFGILVTPATHIVHHAKNPRYLGKNLGAMFTLWDRLFGTYTEVDPADPPQLGMPRGYPSHDGVKAQWIGWSELLASAGRGRSLRDKLTPFFAPPGWRQNGERLPERVAPRPDEAVPKPLGRYALVQFALLVSFAAYVLWLRALHGAAFQVAAAVTILVGLSSLGGLLDGRARSLRHDALRTAMQLALALAMLLSPMHRPAGALLFIASLASAVWLSRLTAAQGVVVSEAITTGAGGV